MTSATLTVTSAGLASASAAIQSGLKITLATFTIGDAFGYVPAASDTAIHGATLYSGTITSFENQADGSLVVNCTIPTQAGPFLFGEIGIYTDAGALFALASLPERQHKETSLGTDIPSTFTLSLFLKLGTGTSIFNLNATGVMQHPIQYVSRWDQVAPRSIHDPVPLYQIIVSERDNKGDYTTIAFKDDGLWSVQSNYFSLVTRGFPNILYVDPGASFILIDQPAWRNMVPGDVATTVADSAFHNFLVETAQGYFRPATISLSGPNVKISFSSPLTVSPPVLGQIFGLFCNSPSYGGSGGGSTGVTAAVICSALGGTASVINDTVTTGVDGASLALVRTTSHTGGNPGYMNAGFMVSTNVGSGVTNPEWALVGIVQNYASAGENVGVYGQGNKNSTGPTWGGVMEVSDNTNVDVTSTYGSAVGLEVDVWCNGTDTEALERRIGIDVVVGNAQNNKNGIPGISKGIVSSAVRIGAQYGNNNLGAFLHGITINSADRAGLVNTATGIWGIRQTGNYWIGIDLSESTHSHAAIRIKADDRISLDGFDTNQIRWNSTNGYLEFLTHVGGVEQRHGYINMTGGADVDLASGSGGSGSGVTTFNLRSGAVTLTGSDVATAATPYSVTVTGSPFVFNNTSVVRYLAVPTGALPTGSTFNVGAGVMEVSFDLNTSAYFSGNDSAGAYLAFILRCDTTLTTDIHGHGMCIGNVSANTSLGAVTNHPTTQMQSWFTGLATPGTTFLAGSGGYSTKPMQDGVPYKVVMTSKVTASGRRYLRYRLYKQDTSITFTRFVLERDTGDVLDDNTFIDMTKTGFVVAHAFNNALAPAWTVTVSNVAVTWRAATDSALTENPSWLMGSGGGGSSGLTSFNGRTGPAITLTSTDVTTALGFTPAPSTGLTTFNGRTGPAVTLTTADVNNAIAAGQLTFTAASSRILLNNDLTTNIGNWTSFQTGLSNAGTAVVALPSGTATTASFIASNSSTSTATWQYTSIGMQAGLGVIETFGKGAAQPELEVSIGGSHVANFSTSGVTSLTGTYFYDAARSLKAVYNAGNGFIEFFNGATRRGYINLASGTDGDLAGVSTFNSRPGAVTLTSLDVTNALGYTPGSSTGLTSFNGRTTPAVVLTSTDVTTALGFTPASTGSFVDLSSTQTITGTKTFGGTGATSGVIVTNGIQQGILVNNVGLFGYASTSINDIGIDLSFATHNLGIGLRFKSGDALAWDTANFFKTKYNSTNGFLEFYNGGTRHGYLDITAGLDVNLGTSFNGRAGAVTLTSSDVTTALGFTPAATGSFVDTTTTQTVGGAKTFSAVTTFSSTPVLSSSLTFTGASSRITLSNDATTNIGNWTSFQTGLSNAGTAVVALPSGTATTSSFLASNNSTSTTTYQYTSFGMQAGLGVIETFSKAAATPELEVSIGGTHVANFSSAGVTSMTSVYFYDTARTKKVQYNSGNGFLEFYNGATRRGYINLGAGADINLSAALTGVTATAPVVSSGGTTPNISMGAASAGVNGYMTGAYASKLDGIAAGATNVTNTNQLTNGAGFITGGSVVDLTSAQTISGLKRFSNGGLTIFDGTAEHVQQVQFDSDTVTYGRIYAMGNFTFGSSSTLNWNSTGNTGVPGNPIGSPSGYVRIQVDGGNKWVAYYV